MLEKQNFLLSLVLCAFGIILGIVIVTGRIMPVATQEKNSPLADDRQIDQADLQKAIDRGIVFLQKDQLPDGEFKSYGCSDEAMRSRCSFYSSPFVTTFVAYSLKVIDEERSKDLVVKALNFLADQMAGPGLWSFVTRKNKDHYDPDSDDTSCASYLLKDRDDVRANPKVFYDHRSRQGWFYTWFVDRGFQNDIDCAVNANVLFYLGETPETKNVCTLINQTVLKNLDAKCSLYYPGATKYYYMLSRAYSQGVHCLEDSRDTVIHKTLSLQKANGSFGGELDTALAVCSLINLGYDSAKLNAAIRFLVGKQKQDGSWEQQSFFYGPEPGQHSYFYYGSAALTTSIALEAIQRYTQHIGNFPSGK